MDSVLLRFLGEDDHSGHDHGGHEFSSSSDDHHESGGDGGGGGSKPWGEVILASFLVNLVTLTGVVVMLFVALCGRVTTRRVSQTYHRNQVNKVPSGHHRQTTADAAGAVQEQEKADGAIMASSGQGAKDDDDEEIARLKARVAEKSLEIERLKSLGQGPIKSAEEKEEAVAGKCGYEEDLMTEEEEADRAAEDAANRFFDVVVNLVIPSFAAGALLGTCFFLLVPESLLLLEEGDGGGHDHGHGHGHGGGGGSSAEPLNSIYYPALGSFTCPLDGRCCAFGNVSISTPDSNVWHVHPGETGYGPEPCLEYHAEADNAVLTAVGGSGTWISCEGSCLPCSPVNGSGCAFLMEWDPDRGDTGGGHDDHDGHDHDHRFLQDAHDEHSHGGSAWKFGAALLGGFIFPLLLSGIFPSHHNDTKVVAQSLKKAFVSNSSEEAPARRYNWQLASSILIGDAFHNFADGIFIGTAFLLCSHDVAWTMVAATVAHELAQEIADFALLTNQCGLPAWKALVLNFLSGFSVMFGALLILGISMTPKTIGVLLAISAGVYVYIGATECVSHLDLSGRRLLWFFFSFAVGATAIGLVLLNHQHCTGDGHDH